jgi:type IV secretory pathway VirD2 relaxase
VSTRAILTVKYTPASPKAGRVVGGFLRYVQHRDHTPAPEREGGIGGLLRYVAHRDAAAPEGRLFDREQTVGSEARKDLVRHVRRSLAEDQERGRPGRAVYRFVISPEDARGLDLRHMARTVMSQLERDTGHELPPWIAAEHRNTAHPHVHVILAARREEEPGRFRELRISPGRLARMKESLTHELERQRGERTRERSMSNQLFHSAARSRNREGDHSHDLLHRRSRPVQARALELTASMVDRFFRRLAFQYHLEAERAAREWEREHGRDRGWER